MPLPDYVCAVIRDHRGRHLLELRPVDSRRGRDAMTCFGGTREPGESIAACLRRELAEELAWIDAPTTDAPLACNLHRRERWIASFYCLTWPEGQIPHTEPGVVAIWAPPSALPGLPLSPWHRVVFEAITQGHHRAETRD